MEYLPSDLSFLTARNQFSQQLERFKIKTLSESVSESVLT